MLEAPWQTYSLVHPASDATVNSGTRLIM